MKFYSYINFSDIPEQDKLSMGQRLNNFIDRKIAEHIPKHLHKLTDDAVIDTNKENYNGKLFKHTRRALDVRKKKKALKKLATYTNSQNIDKLPPTLKAIAKSTIGSDFLRQFRSKINQAYRNAGKEDT